MNSGGPALPVERPRCDCGTCRKPADFYADAEGSRVYGCAECVVKYEGKLAVRWVSIEEVAS